MKTFGDKIKKILSDNNYSYRLKIFPQKEKCLKNGNRQECFIEELISPEVIGNIFANPELLEQ